MVSCNNIAMIPWLKPIFYKMILDVLHFGISKVINELKGFFTNLI